MDINLEFVLQVYELQEDRLNIKGLLYEGPQHNITIPCFMEDDDAVCNDRTILYVNQINYKDYLMVIQVMNADDLVDELRTFEAYVFAL
jgi:hypothetical protein